MRFLQLLKGDIRFQMKYGFYYLYAFLFVVYAALLQFMPNEWRVQIVGIIIYTDPAAMGIFFMGGIILLEKSQRVLDALSVSPIRIHEYILAKVFSLNCIACIIAVLLTLLVTFDNIAYIVLATFLTSTMLTLVGMLIGVNVQSLNQFLSITIPVSILCFTPAILQMMKISVDAAYYYPPNVCARLIANPSEVTILGYTSILITIVLLYVLVHRATKRMWCNVGGAKL